MNIPVAFPDFALRRKKSAIRNRRRGNREGADHRVRGDQVVGLSDAPQSHPKRNPARRPRRKCGETEPLKAPLRAAYPRPTASVAAALINPANAIRKYRKSQPVWLARIDASANGIAATANDSARTSVESTRHVGSSEQGESLCNRAIDGQRSVARDPGPLVARDDVA